MMKTKELLNKAICQHSELNFLSEAYSKGNLQEKLQGIVKQPMRGQGISTHVCIPYVGQLLKAFWEFSKKELNYSIQGLLPDNGISITQLWLRFFMFKNFSKKWNWEKNSWEATSDEVEP